MKEIYFIIIENNWWLKATDSTMEVLIAKIAGQWTSIKKRYESYYFKAKFGAATWTFIRFSEKKPLQKYTWATDTAYKLKD